MKKKSFTIWLSVIWVLFSLLAVAGVTFAWFTFHPATNVEPISSTISDGEVALLISTDPNQDFLTKCVLPQSVSGDLEPVSTANLENFYAANLQNRQGISVKFKDSQDQLDNSVIHGTLYLKSLKDHCAVYFNRNGMDFGNDVQVLASLRLGMKFTTQKGVFTYIFSMNDFANVTGAASARTTAQTGVVIGSLAPDGTPNYVQDPAIGLSDFYATTGTTKLPAAGRRALCVIEADEIASVEYWLYLEGCDENCINDVQEREALLQLSFAGVTSE